jgi:hypothetical protein
MGRAGQGLGVLLGGGWFGEALAGAVQAGAARGLLLNGGAPTLKWAWRPPDACLRLPRRARGPKPRPACATGGAVGRTVTGPPVHSVHVR